MQIKDLDELENQLNEVGASLSQIESLSKIVLDCMHGGDNLKPCDVQNLTSVLGDRISELKQRFNRLAEELNI